MNKPSERLKELGITLPQPTRPVASYVPAVRYGNLLMLSGQIPLRDSQMVFTGKVGSPDGRSLAEAQEAAKLCTLNALGIAADAAGGIDHIKQVLKVVVYVASHEGFTDQHKAANGASDLLVSIFGDAGRHARAAVGVYELPLNATVEVDVLFAV